LRTYIKKEILTFNNPISLSGLDQVLPAGNYTVETVNEFLEGSLQPAYLHIETRFHVRPELGPTRVLTVDANTLLAMKLRDENNSFVKGTTNSVSIQVRDNAARTSNSE
jgi:hypothetical protein